jgi:hypothetical protein
VSKTLVGSNTVEVEGHDGNEGRHSRWHYGFHRTNAAMEVDHTEGMSLLNISNRRHQHPLHDGKHAGHGSREVLHCLEGRL